MLPLLWCLPLGRGSICGGKGPNVAPFDDSVGKRMLWVSLSRLRFGRFSPVLSSAPRSLAAGYMVEGHRM